MTLDTISYTFNLEEERGKRDLWMLIEAENHYKLISF